MEPIKFKKLRPDAIIPRYQSKGAAGFDFHIIADGDNEWVKYLDDDSCTLTIMQGSQCIIDTGLSVVVPDGYEMQIRPRSGLAFKKGITIVNSPGTLDSDYRGPIKVVLFNMGTEPFVVAEGDRIAQGVINKVEQPVLLEVAEFSAEDMEKDRGGGFGSTGMGVAPQEAEQLVFWPDVGAAVVGGVEILTDVASSGVELVAEGAGLIGGALL